MKFISNRKKKIWIICVILVSIIILLTIYSMISDFLEFGDYGSLFLHSLASIGYVYMAYLGLPRLLFVLRFKDRGGRFYFFDGDMLYISTKFSPIPINSIKHIRIRHTSKYRSNRAFKVTIRVEGRLMRYCFGIGDFSIDKEWKIYETFLKQLDKRGIDYEIKRF